MISIITPSVREHGLSTVNTALKRQTFQDFEWLVGTPFEPDFDRAVWVEDDFDGGFWTLNRMYNKLIKRCIGNLVISWQDYTFADPDTLEKFVRHFEQEPQTLVTAVGNKYTQVFPDLGEQIWSDPRITDRHGSYYDCYFNDIEWNLASIPIGALYAVGGFDEELDMLGFGMDGYSVVDRLNMSGNWRFKIDQGIHSYSLRHDRVGGGEDWEKHNLIHGGYQKQREKYIEHGYKLAYL